jgi:putative endopeptidase
MRLKLLCALAMSSLLAPAFGQQTPAATQMSAGRTSFLDRTGMDLSVNPADDFAQYTNGTWMKTTQIPADQSSWGSFAVLRDENLAKTKAILTEAAAARAPKNSIEQKVGDFYASGMDTVAIEKRGYNPVKPLLAQVAAIKDYKQYLALVAGNENLRGGALFGFYVGADSKNSTKNRVRFGQAGTGLPEKDYYFKQDAPTQKVRDAYVKYIQTLFTLTGTDSATARKQANDILAFETQLAQSHKSRVELRDPIKNYHKYAVSELSGVHAMDWKVFLEKLGIRTDSILIGQPEYYTAMGKLLETIPIETIKNREKLNILDNAAPYLSKDFRDARFLFYNKTLNGQPKQPDRWKTVSREIDNGLGELLGQLWVKKYFTPEAKERMISLVNNLQTVYRSRIEKLDWMSAETKQKALVKLDKFTKKIGYPDQWKTYDKVTINRNTYYENVQSARQYRYREMIEKLSKPVDKTEWGMTPPTVNAYANPVYNEIAFPAGILQFPFFDNAADDAINYGGIGAVIGHEMTHLFDDQGRQYDADGNLTDWWTAEDAAKFKAKAQAVVDQYNSFTVLDGLHVNGSLTLGENLADLGGVTLAYEAFKLTEQGKSNQKIDGFTPDQRFFMSWAQIWRIKNRDETLRTRIATDPHSPERYRINGPLMHFEPFYQAFAVKPGNQMYVAPEKRVKIW